MVKHNLHSRDSSTRVPSILFYSFIRGYEVDGYLQKPNVEIVCSSSNWDSNPDRLLK